MYICIYVYMYICIYIYMYICIYIYINIYVSLFLSLSLSLYIYILVFRNPSPTTFSLLHSSCNSLMSLTSYEASDYHSHDSRVPQTCDKVCLSSVSCSMESLSLLRACIPKNRHMLKFKHLLRLFWQFYRKGLAGPSPAARAHLEAKL